MGTPASEIRSWTKTIRDTVYTCSTDPARIQLDALNEALSSDFIWWAKPLGREGLRRMVENSFCFGVYVSSSSLSTSTDATVQGMNGQGTGTGTGEEMVGFARLVTDYVTFGYLTDVYVLPAHQERGLGRWVMVCLNEVLESWPALRRCVLFTADPHAVRLYEQTLGMEDLREGKNGLVVMQKMGRAGAPGKNAE